MNEIFLKIVLLAWCGLIIFRLPATAQQPTEKKTPIGFPIVPVIAEYEYQPYFFAQWIAGHPQYSRIEAVLDNLEKAEMLQIVLVEKEKGKRVYYCASERDAKMLRAEGREVYLAAIDFKTAPAVEGQPTYGFGFRDKGGQAILWRVTPATRPSERGAGLTPLASAPGLRLEYRDLGTAVGAGTAIQIGDKVIEAEPWAEISAPPYFVAYRGTVAVGRHTGNFLLGARNWRLVSRPDKLREGAEWIFRDENERRRQFKIAAQNGGELIVNEQGTNSTLTSFVIHTTESGQFLLRSVQFRHNSQTMRIRFEPELSLDAPDKFETTFAISQGKNDKIASGTISGERLNGDLRLRWQPKAPDWAKSRMLESLIKIESAGFSIETTQPTK